MVLFAVFPLYKTYMSVFEFDYDNMRLSSIGKIIRAIKNKIGKSTARRQTADNL